MPEIIFETLDAIPEGLREGAKEVNGKMVINVVPKAKLDEFRDNNVALSTERDSLKKSVEGFAALVGDKDQAEFATELEALRKTAQDVADGKLKGDDTVASEVARRVETLKSDYERRLQEAGKETLAWKDKAVTNDTKFRRSIVDREVTNAILDEASGAHPSARADILARAYNVFHVGDDGKLTARDGEATIYGANGTDPMSPSEWLGKLKEQAPYFFKGSTGGGAGGSGDKKLPGGMTKEDFDKLSGSEKLALARKHNL